MKNTTKLLNLLTTFLAVIGICAASLVLFIVAYTQINGGFSPKYSADYGTAIAKTDNSINTISLDTDSNDNSVPKSLSDTDTLNNYNTTESISLAADQMSTEAHEYPTYEYDTNTAFPENDYVINTEANNTSDSALYAMPIEQEISATPHIEQNEPNTIYSSEVPIESSNQMINGSITTENGNNLNAYYTPESQGLAPATDTVWLSATGEKYHSINHCGRMNPNKARQVSLEYAISEGYGPCEKCF